MAGARAIQPPVAPRPSTGLDIWLGRQHAASSTVTQKHSIRPVPVPARDHHGAVQGSDDEDVDRDEIVTPSRSTTVTPSQQLRVPLSSPPQQPPVPSFFERHARGYQRTDHERPPREEQEEEDMDEVDELAGNDGPLPLIISDLDPTYHSPSVSGMAVRFQKQQPPTASSQLSIRAAQQPTTTATIPIPQFYNTQAAPSTPNRPVSVSIPSLSPAATARVGSDRAPTSAHKNASPVVAVGRRSAVAGVGAGVKVKGRPKGWKPGMSYREAALRNMGMDSEEAAAAAATELLLPPPKKRKGRPLGAKNADSEQSGRRGRRSRPSGSTVAGRKPDPDYNSIYQYRRPGRPPLQPIERIQRSIFVKTPITYIPFLCEWAGCRAELQNMATLRKHVRVVHGQARTCLWRRCASRVPAVVFRAENEDGNDKDHDHTHRESFMEHMEYHHLAPLQWHQGDGFVNNSHLGTLVITPPQPRGKRRTEDNNDNLVNDAEVSTDKIPQYLLDDEGRQITPQMQDPQLKSVVFSWTQEERVRRLKDLYRQQQQQQHRRPDRGWSLL